MDSRLPYRRGWPLLKPLPLVTIPLKKDVLMGQDDTDLSSKIVQILRRHNILFEGVTLVGRVHTDDNPDSPNPTYFILINLERSPVNTWDPAVQAIRNLLDGCNLTHIAVEAMDIEKAGTRSCTITKKNLFTDDEVEIL